MLTIVLLIIPTIIFALLAVADSGHFLRGRFICFTFSVATSGNSYE